MCKPGQGCCGCAGSRVTTGAMVAAGVAVATVIGVVVQDVVVVAGCVMTVTVVVLGAVLVRLLRRPGPVLYRPGEALPAVSRKVIEGRVVPAVETNRQVHSHDRLVQLPDRLV